uniref:C2H2-type domain-containing protein n=1 Tax=Seriola dumerili TaxID=41447 RepID=A0A3B4USN9_SERDU
APGTFLFSKIMNRIDDLSWNLKRDKPAVGMSTHGSSNYTMMLSVASQPEWKSGSVTHNVFLPLSETGNPPQKKPHVNNSSVTQSSISSDMDPTHQYQVQVFSANVDTSVCKTYNGHTCKVCLKSFSSSLQLWIHLPTHNKPKPFQRGPTFSKKACLKVCMQINTLHQCHTCSKCFPSASKLQRHMMTHTGQRPFGCEICGKRFRVSKLQRHEMVHTGLKPFQCPTCGKAFRQASHLKTHERIHCKRKPSKSYAFSP